MSKTVVLVFGMDPGQRIETETAIIFTGTCVHEGAFDVVMESPISAKTSALRPEIAAALAQANTVYVHLASSVDSDAYIMEVWTAELLRKKLNKAVIIFGTEDILADTYLTLLARIGITSEAIHETAAYPAAHGGSVVERFQATAL